LNAGSAYGSGRDVRKISSNTGGVDNIVKGQLVNKRAQLEEEGEWLFAPGQFSCSNYLSFVFV
jgi:hypothetical protein